MMFASLLRIVGQALVVATVLSPSQSLAQVVETRRGEANPMVAVFKSTLYGGGAGLLLGLAIELVDNDETGEAVKWGFVSGTFFGFAYGLYHVSTRAEPRAMLDRSAGTWALAPPHLEIVSRGVRPETQALAGTGFRAQPSVEARIRLVSLRF